MQSLSKQDMNWLGEFGRSIKGFEFVDVNKKKKGLEPVMLYQLWHKVIKDGAYEPLSESSEAKDVGTIGYQSEGVYADISINWRHGVATLKVLSIEAGFIFIDDYRLSNGVALLWDLRLSGKEAIKAFNLEGMWEQPDQASPAKTGKIRLVDLFYQPGTCLAVSTEIEIQEFLNEFDSPKSLIVTKPLGKGKSYYLVYPNFDSDAVKASMENKHKLIKAAGLDDVSSEEFINLLAL